MTSYQRNLTAPEEIRESRRFLPVGNEFVSLPTLDARTGGSGQISAVSDGLDGLVELVSRPDQAVLQPFVSLARGGDLELTWCSGRPTHWTPYFEACQAGLAISWSVVTPRNIKGLVYLVRVESRGYAGAVTVGLRGEILDAVRTVFSRRPLRGALGVRYDPWTRSLVIEHQAGRPTIAMAMGVDGQPDHLEWRCGEKTVSGLGFAGEGAVYRTGRRPWSYRLGVNLDLSEGQAGEVPLYVALNRDGDGARTTVMHLRRVGGETLSIGLNKWLEANRVPTSEPARGRLLNENLYYGFFFSVGKTIDTDEVVITSSRDSRYYVSGAFWSRDLIWAYPGVVRLDPGMARELLLTVFHRYLRNAGDHALYLAGGSLYPGFEMDQVCAFVLTLDDYLAATHDDSVLQEPDVTRGLRRLLAVFQANLDERRDLFRTFLLPTDDPAVHPYVTYDNVLAWWSLKALARMAKTLGWDTEAESCAVQAERTKRAIQHRLVAEGPFGPMYAWSWDGERGLRLYDEPPGSLSLLSYYGFCGPDDPVYRNTVRWIHSPFNEHYSAGLKLSGPGCAHAVHPWVLSYANALLSRVDPEVDHHLTPLEESPLDNGLACESVDEDSGVVKTGPGFAPCAAFLAYALARREQAGWKAREPG